VRRRIRPGGEKEKLRARVKELERKLAAAEKLREEREQLGAKVRELYGELKELEGLKRFSELAKHQEEYQRLLNKAKGHYKFGIMLWRSANVGEGWEVTGVYNINDLSKLDPFKGYEFRTYEDVVLVLREFCAELERAMEDAKRLNELEKAFPGLYSWAAEKEREEKSEKASGEASARKEVK
jgi:hypothetical protein